MQDTITFHTTRSHKSISELDENVSSLCDASINDLLSGEARKTLLETAQVKVEIVIPYGNNEERVYSPYYVIYLSFKNERKALQTKFQSEVIPLISEAFKRNQESLK